MKSYIFGLAIIAAVFVSAPNAQAYLTTKQEATRISDNLALFQIEYSFGRKDDAVYMPVRAARNQVWGTQNKQIGFEIIKDGVVTNEGQAAGVVIAPIAFSLPNSSNEQYVTPVGMALPMSLFVILQVEPSATTSSYRIQVTDLPFYLGKDMKYQKLNPSELQYYRTPAVKLNRNLAE